MRYFFNSSSIYLFAHHSKEKWELIDMSLRTAVVANRSISTQIIFYIQGERQKTHKIKYCTCVLFLMLVSTGCRHHGNAILLLIIFFLETLKDYSRVVFLIIWSNSIVKSTQKNITTQQKLLKKAYTSITKSSIVH